MKPSSWLLSINRIPPCFCRLVARKGYGKKPMSNSEIAKISGLARSTVNKLSHMRDWNHVTCATVQRFTTACGVDLLRPKEAITKFKRAKKLVYTSKGQPAQRRMYDRLLTPIQASPARSKEPSASQSGPQSDPQDPPRTQAAVRT